MMKLVDRYILGQLLVAAIAVTFASAAPVILVSLLDHLPIGSIPGSVLLPALYGIGSMILYQAMPALVAIAIIWVYGRFLTDNTLVTLFMAGRSLAAVKAPALIVAFLAVAAGYGLSLHFAPDSAKFVQDILFVIRRDMNVNLFEAERFNTFGRNGEVFFFERRVGEDKVANVFIWQLETDADQNPVKKTAYSARYGVFGGEPGNRWVALLDGTMLVDEYDPKKKFLKVDFTELKWRPLEQPGTSSSQRSRIYNELSTPDFLAALPSALDRQRSAQNWVQEAVKRFGFPLLTVLHTIFGLECLMLFGAMNDRNASPSGLINAMILAAHVVVVISANVVGQTSFHVLWVVAGVVLLELAATLALMNPPINRKAQDFVHGGTLKRLYVFEQV